MIIKYLFNLKNLQRAYMILVAATLIFINIASAASPWIQTDWSGGTSSGGAISTNPTTTYLSSGASNVSHATSGQIGLDAPEQFTNTGFETNLTGWNVPFSSTVSSFFGNDYLVPDDDNLSFGNGTTDQPFSISAWVKKDWNGYYLAFLSKSSSGNSAEWEFRNHYWNNALSANFHLYDTSTGGYIGKSLSLNQKAGRNNWVHLVGTYDGSMTSNGVKMYVNGILASSNTQDVGGYGNSYGGTYVAMENTTHPLYVGLLGSTYKGSGFMDEVSLWSKELTANEVAEIYNYEQPTDLQNDPDLASALPYLRSWWRMGETGEAAGVSVLYDIIGNYNMVKTGLWSPGTTAFYTTPPGRSNFSVDFDGTNEYVSVADANTLSFTSAGQDQPFTLSGWLYMDDATNFPIFSKGTTTSREYSFDTMGGAGDRLRLTIQDPTGSNYIGVYSTNALTAYEGSWVHVAATYSGSEAASGIKLYVNGTQVATTNETSGSFTGMTNGTGTAKIANIFGDAYYANGKIDDLSLWNTALSQSQISELVATGAPTMLRGHSAVANLVSWWRFDHAFETAAYTNTSAFDTIGSNTGTMTNTENADFVTATPAPLITRDTSIKYSGSHGTNASAKVVNTAIAGYNFTQSVNVGDTDPYNLVAYAYTSGVAVTSADVELVANGSTITTTYTSMGSGWYKLSGVVTGSASSIAYGAQVKSGKTVYLDDFSLSNYETSGTFTSRIFDTEQASSWGAVTYNPKNNYAVSFDGVNESAYLNGTSLNGYTQYTTSLWVKTSSASNNKYFFANPYSNNYWNGADIYQDYSGTTLRSMLPPTTDHSGGGSVLNSNTAINDGAWHHIAATYDGSTGKVYIDGVLKNSSAWTGTLTNLYTTITLAAFNATSGNIATDIDEVSIWDRGLSATEISAIYNSGTPLPLTTHPAIANLDYWWRMGDDSLDDLTATTGTVRDQIGSGHLTPRNTESADKVASSIGGYGTSLKIRTGNQSNMSDAVDWATCDPITSGADISDNNCVDDGDQYIQYQVAFTTASPLVTPILSDISVEYELGGIMVDATGTQQTTLPFPSVNKNIGGAFTIYKPGAIPATITSITISNTGTVDGANLENIRVYYKEQATCSSFIPGSATLFGTASTMTSNTATVSGSMNIDSDQTCVYVQLDAASGTTQNNETIELEITNPATDIVASDPEETIIPETVVAIDGTTTLGSATSETTNILSVTGIDGCVTEFFSTDGVLWMREKGNPGNGNCPETDQDFRLTSDQVYVSNLAFTELTSGDNQSVVIEMTLTDNNTGTRNEFVFEQDFSTSVTLRQ